MNAALKLVLEECDSTAGTVDALTGDLTKYGFNQNVTKGKNNLTSIINRKGRGGYSRV